MRASRSALAVFAGLLAAACSDGGGDESSAPPEHLHGALAFPIGDLAPLAGIEVRALDADGVVVATTTASSSGTFAIGAASWDGFTGRIEADAVWPRPGAEPLQLRLVRDVGAEYATARCHWLGPISTLASRYRTNHPDLGIEAAHSAAAAHLGIPAVGAEPGVEIHTGFGDSHRSPAAWSLLRAGAGSSTLDAFFDQLTAELEAGAPPRSFRMPHPYPRLRQLLYGDDVAASASSARTRTEASFFSWSSEAGRVVTDYRIMAFDQLFGFALEKAGGGGVSTVELAEAIAEIQNELSALSLTLQQNELTEAWGYTAGAVADPAVETIRTVNNLYLQYMLAVPQSTSAAASLLQLRQQDVLYAVTSLRELLAGGPAAPFGPIGAIYARSKSLGRFGAATSEAEDSYWNGMQFRDNQLLDEARVATDYYCGWMTLGANLLVEWSHLNPSTFPVPLAGNANTLPAKATFLQGLLFGDATQAGVNAVIRQAQQTVPPAILGSENVLVDCGWNNVGVSGSYQRNLLPDIGTMFHKFVQYCRIGYTEFSGSYTLADGAFPAGSFRAATLAEYKRLRARAYAVNPSSPKQGLQALGFHVTLGAGDLKFGYYHNLPGVLENYGWNLYTFDQDKDDGSVNKGDGVNVIPVRNTPGDRGYTSSYVYPVIDSEDAGTAFAVGRWTGFTLDAPSQATGRVAMSRRQFSSPAYLYPSSRAVADQELSLITPANVAQAPFSVDDWLWWQTSDPTAALPTNLPIADWPSRVVWRQGALGVGGDTLTGAVIQGLTRPAGKLGCMPRTQGAPQTGAIALDASFDPAVFGSLRVTPDGLSYDLLDFAQSPTVNCYATGYFVSQSTAASTEPVGVAMVDMSRTSATTGTVQWSASSPSGLAYFLPGSNVLHLEVAQGVETVTITATIARPGGGTLQASGTLHVALQ